MTTALQTAEPALDPSPSRERQRHRHLVYTSAGHRSNIARWLSGPRAFDLWITHYDAGESPHRGAATHYDERRGAKFQNLHHAFQAWPEVFAGYEAVLVMDDDVLLDGADIGRLFALREAHDLWLLQPAFHPRGKVSHPITRWRPGVHLRFTSFVEVTCPLFRADRLADFMRVYDPALVGWGIDWWFLHELGPDLRGHVAIADAVPCVNPHDRAVGLARRIDEVQDRAARKRDWERLRAQKGIEEIPQVVFATLAEPAPHRFAARVRQMLDVPTHLEWWWFRAHSRAAALSDRLASRGGRS